MNFIQSFKIFITPKTYKHMIFFDAIENTKDNTIYALIDECYDKTIQTLLCNDMHALMFSVVTGYYDLARYFIEEYHFDINKPVSLINNPKYHHDYFYYNNIRNYYVIDELILDFLNFDDDTSKYVDIFSRLRHYNNFYKQSLIEHRIDFLTSCIHKIDLPNDILLKLTMVEDYKCEKLFESIHKRMSQIKKSIKDKYDEFFTVKDYLNRNIFHYFAKNNTPMLLRYAVDNMDISVRNALLNSVDKYGYTPFGTAIETKHHSVALLLKKMNGRI